MIPDFAGKTITIVKLDYSLYLWTDDNWVIQLAGPVLVSIAGSAPTQIDVSVADSPLPAELDGVAGSTITNVLVTEDGHLGVQLGDRLLSVRAAEMYEAWEIAGPDGERLISTPGGELTHFPPVRPNAPTGNP